MHGYHIYKDIWDAVIDEELLYVKGSPITEAIDMQLPSRKIGELLVIYHVKYHACSLFLRRGNEITCRVTGH